MTKRKIETDHILPEAKRKCIDNQPQKPVNGLLNSRKNEDIVVFNIMKADGFEDGPCPAKDTKKIPNSVDRFEEEHQGQYKAREKTSDSNISRVEEHNSTYPKMRNELENRKSTAKVEVLSLNRSNHTKTFENINLTPIRLYTGKPVTKRRKRNPIKNRRKSSECQICAFLDEIGKMYDDYILTAELQMARRREFCGKMSRVRKSIDCLDTSNPSMSSYHSFASTDHEPMVFN